MLQDMDIDNDLGDEISSIVQKSQILNLKLNNKYTSEMIDLEKVELCFEEVYLEEKLLE